MNSKRIIICLSCFSIFCVQLSCTARPSDSSSGFLGIKELDEIKSIRVAYTRAWLANDSSAIIKTLTRDAVLIPHHGDSIVSGISNIKEFWWPDGASASYVTVFNSTFDEIHGNQKLAYIIGRFNLHFVFGDSVYKNEGNYLNILKRENELWKLSRLIWNDPVSKTKPLPLNE